MTLHLAYGYDTANRRTSQTYPDGQQQSWSYDAAGQITAVTQPGGGRWTVAHDGAGNRTGLSAPNGGQQSWSYDPAGRLTGTTWLSGTTTLFSQTATQFDAVDELLIRTSSLAGTTTYRYDGAGDQVGSSGPSGLVTDTYNDLGQLMATNGPGGTSNFVADGQGDRLRAYTQGTARWTLSNAAGQTLLAAMQAATITQPGAATAPPLAGDDRASGSPRAAPPAP